jgi:hypothetical protein
MVDFLRIIGGLLDDEKIKWLPDFAFTATKLDFYRIRLISIPARINGPTPFKSLLTTGSLT